MAKAVGSCEDRRSGLRRLCQPPVGMHGGNGPPANPVQRFLVSPFMAMTPNARMQALAYLRLHPSKHAACAPSSLPSARVHARSWARRGCTCGTSRAAAWWRAPKLCTPPSARQASKQPRACPHAKRACMGMCRSACTSSARCGPWALLIESMMRHNSAVAACCCISSMQALCRRAHVQG